MRAILFSFLALTFGGVAHAELRAAAIPDYPAERVAAHTYVIHGPMGYPSPGNRGFMNNPAFVVTKSGVVVIDPGSSVQTGAMLLRQIAKVTQRPVVAVLNTHVHGDHFLGNQAIREAYPKVPIYGHPHMIAAMDRGAGQEWAERMLSMTQGATAGTLPVTPDHAVDNGDVVAVDGTHFRFHYTGKAHTDSDLMIEVPEEGVLFLADNVNNKRIVRMDDGSIQGNIAAIDAAKEIRASTYVPGHGRTGGREMLDAYRGYLSTLHDTVAKYYAQGMADYEMKPKVAAALADYHDWPGFDEELGKHISLTYLEIESAGF